MLLFDAVVNCAVTNVVGTYCSRWFVMLLFNAVALLLIVLLLIVAIGLCCCWSMLLLDCAVAGELL